MICSGCHKDIPDDAKFCRYCGKKIPVSPDDPVENKPDENSNIDFAVSDETESSGDKSKNSLKGYPVLFTIASAMAVAFIWLRNTNRVDFDHVSLKSCTFTGVFSKLTIDSPFQLSDGKLDPVDEKVIKHVLYKTGVADNLSIEVTGITHTFLINPVSDLRDMSLSVVDSLREDRDFSNLTSGRIENSNINGSRCTRQTVNFYHEKGKANVEAEIVVFVKNNDLWFVMVSYKKGDDKARDFANKVIETIKIK